MFVNDADIWLHGSFSDTMFINDADIRLDSSTSDTIFVNDALKLLSDMFVNDAYLRNYLLFQVTATRYQK